MLVLNKNNINKNKITAIFQLQLPCNEAKNDSIIGPLFGQYGIKGVEFCKKYNDYTLSLNLKTGLILKSTIIIYKNRNIDIFLKTSPLFFLLYIISINNKIVLVRDLYRLLLVKRQDVFYISLYNMYKSLLNTLKSYNYEIQ